MNWGNHFLKNQIKKQKINVRILHVNRKPIARKKIWCKQQSRPRMNWMDWEKRIENNRIQKIEKKNSKNESVIGACEQKTTSEKENFCSNTVFLLYFKIRAKKFHAANALAFSLSFLFQRDQNHYSIWLQKSWKSVNRSQKKRPNTIQILWIVKWRKPK